MLIVGEKEEAEGTVSVRQQGATDKGAMKINEFAEFITKAVSEQMNAY